ncbi:Fur family transcriptional regulator [Siphonobacter aquaeclarae]|jgi:Fe2+ or Zn2+ uptake regulation protein|uniref:Ferric uptake regulator family protein n=1 Tax=Siphonobacter aquaeclarae TaxID=563176 RepID=A0A1G9MSQ5_9BACT|nr:transcriptional repressor [Siphonobacter aquaeclarae]MBO9640122.1 transcriptional repressor [Siphonobacter aquaeclarae]SDL77134.1 Ferric uptake regulator family protein [Siphonobacter aquaeclarae]
MTSLADKIADYCQEKGLRNSFRRVQVAGLLERATEPVSAEELWILLRQEEFQMSIGAVYVALAWLVEAGFARKIPGHDRTFRYALPA